MDWDFGRINSYFLTNSSSYWVGDAGWKEAFFTQAEVQVKCFQIENLFLGSWEIIRAETLLKKKEEQTGHFSFQFCTKAKFYP